MRITIGGMGSVGGVGRVGSVGGVGRVGSVGRMGSYGRGVDSYDKRKRYDVKLVLGPKIESLQKKPGAKNFVRPNYSSRTQL